MIEILNEMLKDTAKYHRPKDHLMKIYIQDRLTASLMSYYTDLSKSLTYLQNRNTDNLVRKAGQLND